MIPSSPHLTPSVSRSLRHLRRAGLTLLACAAAISARAAVGDPALIVQDPTIKAALAAAKKNEPEMIELQVHLNEIPAPFFKEQARAAEMKKLFEKEGLQNVFIDKEGNVLGTRPGINAKPHVVIAAHLDTVFPEGTDVKVKRDGNVLRAPGIGDDTRGLACLLGAIRAMNEAKVKTNGTITFVANVGEEGLGDLRGVKALFNDTLKDQIDYFISVEPGLVSHITYQGVGSYRYRAEFKGPGGHSYGAFGLVNPIHALGRAIDKIADIQVPVSPKTTFNVGRIGGGTSVNSIAFEAWAEIDMRSPDVASLEAVNVKIKAAVQEAVKEENARWKNNGLITAELVPIGFRPAGQTDPEGPIIKATQSAVRTFGMLPTLGAGSTDSNIPFSMGIPAVTIGAGGIAKDAHSLAESFDTTDSWKGPQLSILVLMALTQ